MRKRIRLFRTALEIAKVSEVTQQKSRAYISLNIIKNKIIYIERDEMEMQKTKNHFNIKKWIIIGSVALLPLANQANANAYAGPKANAKIISIKALKGPYYDGLAPGSTEVIARLNDGDEVGHVYSLRPKLYMGEKVDAVLGKTGYYNFYPIITAKTSPAVKCPPAVANHIYKPIIRKENSFPAAPAAAPAVALHLKANLHKETAIPKPVGNSIGYYLDKIATSIVILGLLSVFAYKKIREIKEKKKKAQKK